MFSDRIEFYNPGGLPADITPQNIVDKQYSRNPIIAKVLAKVRYIEELGEGWNKIVQEHKTHLLKPRMPKIKSDSYTSLVNIFSVKDKFEIRKEFVQLSERQKKAIKYVKNRGSIARSEYIKINNISHKTAHLELKELVEKNLFIQEGKGRAAKYLFKR